jgi:dephospho-CoA kinase
MPTDSPFIVGLTGGIGSGKSTVTSRFENLGVAVVDADNIARELTQPGARAIAPISDAFGVAVLTADGALDRAMMRGLAFSDAGARAKLEAILHPMIREETLVRVLAARKLNSGKVSYIVLAVPLLFEAMSFRALIARTLLIDCPIELQIKRVMQRSSLTRDEAARIMSAQIARPVRLQLADDLLSNVTTPADLDAPVMQLHAHYLALAAAHHVKISV